MHFTANCAEVERWGGSTSYFCAQYGDSCCAEEEQKCRLPSYLILNWLSDLRDDLDLDDRQQNVLQHFSFWCLEHAVASVSRISQPALWGSK